MSDNAIFVKRTDDGGWAVWMGCLSDTDCARIPLTATAYPTQAMAMDAAKDRAANEGVEHGVVWLAPQASLERAGGPCRIPGLLEDRDRLWCLALVSTLGIEHVHAVLVKLRDLRSREAEVLGALARSLEPH